MKSVTYREADPLNNAPCPNGQKRSEHHRQLEVLSKKQGLGFGVNLIKRCNLLSTHFDSRDTLSIYVFAYYIKCLKVKSSP